MKTKAIVGLLLGSALLVSCNESPTWIVGPIDGTGMEATGPSASVIADVDVLQRLVPLASDVSATRAIGADGGTIHLREAGLKVIVPEGALALDDPEQTVEITVTALQGADVAYRFEPHGLEFAKPLRVQQDAKVTTAERNSAHRIAQGAYFPEADALDGAGGAQISEFRETAFSRTGSKFRWTVEHFSGYLLATGRRGR